MGGSRRQNLLKKTSFPPMRIFTRKDKVCKKGTGLMANAKRKEERVHAALPVDLGNGTGITRDVSASGMYFETDVDYAAGSEISLSIEFDTPGGKLVMKCQGQIVRVEHRDGKVGVAAKIIESRFEAAS